MKALELKSVLDLITHLSHQIKMFSLCILFTSCRDFLTIFERERNPGLAQIKFTYFC